MTMEGVPNSGVGGLANKFLSVLESKEAELLTWGIVDGGFSFEELLDEADGFLALQDSYESAEELVEDLERRKLLFRFNIGGSGIYRTRAAESVRLFARLRQWFPGKDWRVAPTLVSDFRYSTRPRAYPPRSISQSSLIERLENRNLLTPLEREAMESLLTRPDGQELLMSEFQARAAGQLLADLKSSRTRGTIISAGTGAGKTLAFYLPAMTHIASLLKRNDYWTKCIAIYPRNELLKDQFSEIYSLARRMDSVLQPKSGRKLIIAAFFGSTPNGSFLNQIKARKWEEWDTGVICPYLNCVRCEGELLWRKDDIDRKIERLVCASPDCGFVIEQDEIVLTRNSMNRTRPDILLTSTEMLNRQMSSSVYRDIFGIGSPRPPRMLLLDEAHIYSGVHGAQVAHLLRRWQHAIRAPVHITGLSATLNNARVFFSQLTNINISRVQEISVGNDLEYESAEYQLALRGDPVSGTSLLSTTIQTAMLMRRVLDPNDSDVSLGAYGRRVFLFTEDLDVTNRLYHNIQDAEGLDSNGRPKTGRVTLASLRSRNEPDNALRLQDGQSWLVSEEIGHPEKLTEPLVTGRTSSQDTGVNEDADVVVASPSLEVGYDDQGVGAIIQHKAPRDMASFVQRRGRAGRSRAMRPWTIVVLSDYGRDRLAYQGYDLLFDPLLPPKSLPVANRYVLRMQSVYAFMDWVANQIPHDLLNGSVWNDFSGPPYNESHSRRQQFEAGLIRRVMEQDYTRQNLETFLAEALSISNDEVLSLMWESPRPLMTAALPTLLRRLESGWGKALPEPDEPVTDFITPFAPLPEFVPQNLFSDLNLPEVAITLPALRNNPPRESSMPIRQAMQEFAPGRVTRRFGISWADENHWIAPLDLHSTQQKLPVESICVERDEIGPFQIWNGNEIEEVRCVRAWKITPSLPPNNVLPTSNARLEWRTQILSYYSGSQLELPDNSVWNTIIREARLYTHNQQSPAEVRRFAIGSNASISIRPGGHLETSIEFVDGESGRTAGVGFRQEVDALLFRIELPDDLKLNADAENREKIRAYRSAYFRHRVVTDPVLTEEANHFQRDWLFQIYFSAISSRAFREGISLEQANLEIESGDVAGELAAVLKNIFQTLEADLSNNEDIPISDSGETGQRVHDAILGLCRIERVASRLSQLARVLWEEPGDDWREWGRTRLKRTLGDALLEACSQVVPNLQDGDLLVDIDSGPAPAGASHGDGPADEIWITETTLGGTGIIEEVIRRFISDPGAFFRLAESALGPSDHEIVDIEVTRVLDMAAKDDDIKAAFEEVRNSFDFQRLKNASDELQRLLISKGILTSHSVMSSINSRILRPRSSEATDRFLLKLIQSCQAEEMRLGIELDARVFAYVASQSRELCEELDELASQARDEDYWRFQIIYGLLWPRGHAVRSRALDSYNPFAEMPPADRQILRDVLLPDRTDVSISDENWKSIALSELSSSGFVRLHASFEERNRLKQVILQLAAEPLESGFLYVYPQVVGFDMDAEGVYAVVNLLESVQ